MERIDKYIPKEYLALRINYRRIMLAELPVVKLTEHTLYGVPTKRISIDNHRYNLNTPAGENCMEIYKQRKLCEQELRCYEAIWEAHFTDEPLQECMPHNVNRLLRVSYNQQVVMNKAFFDSLKNDADTRHPKPSYYPFKGIFYRSAAERDIAVFLDDMGIPFKYEPEISLTGLNYTIHPDFVIYIEEIDTCIIIEHLGIKNSSDYIRDNKIKYGNYTGAGLISGVDFLFTHDTDNLPFDIRGLISALNNAIYQLLISDWSDAA